MEFLTPEAQAMEPSAVRPHFYMRQKQHKAESEKQGRPIFRDVEYIEIFIAGDKHFHHDVPVTEEHKHRFPEHYRRFKEGQEDVLIGTPIEQWAALSRARCMELRSMNIRTVEELSELSDSSIQNIGMDGRSLVMKAKAFLAAAEDGKAIEKYAADNERLTSEIEMLKKQVAELAAMKGKK